MDDYADGVSIPTAGLFLTARDWALVANFIQERINQNNCMGKYLKECINSASKPSRTKWWMFGYHFWTTKIGSQLIIIFAGYGGQAIFINPKTQEVVMASSVNPKYGSSNVFKKVQKVLKEAGE